jgi:hypothetical protein
MNWALNGHILWAGLAFFWLRKKKGGCGLPNLFTSDLSAMFGLLTDMGAWDMA